MKFQKQFEFFDTEAEALEAAAHFDAAHPGWRAHRAAVTPWESLDRKERKYICWTFI